MKVPSSVHGAIAPVFTAFNEDATLDDIGQRNLLDFMLTFDAISAFFCRSGMGQMYEFQRDDVFQLIDNVCAHMAGKAPVLIGCNGIWNRDKSEGGRPDPAKYIAECTEFGKHAADAGASGIVYTVPEALIPREGESHQSLSIRFFDMVSSVASAPVFIYQPPATEKIYELLPETLGQIAEMPNVVAIKVSNPDAGYMFDLIKATQEKEFAYICGAETAFYAAVFAGGKACIGQGASLNPQILRAVQDSCIAGDISGMFAAQESVNYLCRACPNPVEWLKRYATEKGYAVQPFARESSASGYGKSARRKALTQDEYEMFKTVYERELESFGLPVAG